MLVGIGILFAEEIELVGKLLTRSTGLTRKWFSRFFFSILDCNFCTAPGSIFSYFRFCFADVQHVFKFVEIFAETWSKIPNRTFWQLRRKFHPILPALRGSPDDCRKAVYFQPFLDSFKNVLQNLEEKGVGRKAEK